MLVPELRQAGRSRRARKPELHVPDFAFGSVLSLDILKSSKGVGYMYRGV